MKRAMQVLRFPPQPAKTAQAGDPGFAQDDKASMVVARVDTMVWNYRSFAFAPPMVFITFSNYTIDLSGEILLWQIAIQLRKL